MKSSSEGVRDDAVVPLGLTLSKSAVPHLIEALGDEFGMVRQSAEATLTTIASILEKKRFTERFQKLRKDNQRQPAPPTYPGGTTSKSTLRPHSADTTGES